MNIDTWLSTFKEAWISHNVDAVLSLFHSQVIYYETPFNKLDDFAALENAWKTIKKQNNIQLNLKVFCSKGNMHAVLWRLEYTKSGEVKKYAGTYLIELNSDNKCIYFFHTCENNDYYNNS